MIRNHPYACLLALLLCGACGTALAHEGHHDAEAQADVQPAAPPSPNATLDTPQLELVAQREGGDIMLYLDDYATNAPLNGLQVSVRSGTLTLQAAASGEGSYRIPGDLIDAQAAPTLAIAVHGAGIDAQLQAEVPPAVPTQHAAQAGTAAADSLWPRWIVAVALAALVAAAAGWRLRRRRNGRVVRGLGAA